MGVFVIHAFIAHKLSKEASVSSHARNDHTNVLMNFENFLLVVCQIVGALFQTNHYDVRVRFEAEGSGTLLDSFLSVINLQDFALRVEGRAITRVLD